MAEIMQNTVKEMKTIQALNLRQKLLNQVSDAYILVTGDIKVQVVMQILQY